MKINFYFIGNIESDVENLEGNVAVGGVVIHNARNGNGGKYNADNKSIST